MFITFSVDASDPLTVRYRSDLRAEDGGVAFVDIGNVSFLMSGPPARKLRDELIAALDAHPDDSPAADGGSK